jgi:hypothetical protein
MLESCTYKETLLLVVNNTNILLTNGDYVYRKLKYSSFGLYDDLFAITIYSDDDDLSNELDIE